VVGRDCPTCERGSLSALARASTTGAVVGVGFLMATAGTPTTAVQPDFREALLTSLDTVDLECHEFSYSFGLLGRRCGTYSHILYLLST